MNTELLDYYAQRAQEYEEVYAKPERQADLEQVRCWLRAELSGELVLELACGTGYWTAWLAPATRGILATDARPEVLDLARQKTYPPESVRFALADAYDLGALPGSFSAAFAGFFWSHVPWKRVPDFLRGLHGRLGAGTRVVFIDNRYVAGSSTPIARRDGDGNTYQRRRLANGAEIEVLKNFPTRAQLGAALGGGASGVQIVEFEHYWGVSYVTRGTA